MQPCLTLKVLFGLPLRQATGCVDSLLELVGLDFSTLCRRQKTLSVATPYKGSTGPLHLLIGSRRLKAAGEGEWNARSHGDPKRRQWRKIHIGNNEQTLEICAIEVTTISIGYATILPDLLTTFHQAKSSAASRLMGLTTHTNATVPVQPGLTMPSCPRAKIPSYGSPIHPGRGHAMKPDVFQTIWEAHCASRRANSISRLQRSKFVPRS